MNDVVAELIERRHKLGLSQEEVGDRMGIQGAAVSRFESGDDPHVSTILRYARAVEARVSISVEDVRPQVKWEAIARFLRELIEVAPDQWLPSEAALQKLFEVSRGTVRRALWELSKERLIESRQGRGWFPVAPYDTPGASDA